MPTDLRARTTAAMPSNRRLKATGLIALLTLLVIVYVTTGAKNTQNSAFYTRTVEAMHNRQSAASHDAVLADEKARADRVARVQKEHEGAMESKAPSVEEKEGQKPIGVQEAEQSAQGGKKVAEGSGGKGVAGRKMVPTDGRVVINEKGDEGLDGVAKVGNTGPRESEVAKGADDEAAEEAAKVEEEMNAILKKGPVIVFSKSYCPFSMKAKHILLDLYTITPPPYVVELDQHELGPGLQAALLKSTGRRTVPNVLINGKSIGGGDDIQELHETGKLAETVQAMGGKRVMSVKPNPKPAAEKRGANFRS
ncbi:hypothetical protein B0A48_07952 [Cryoendolithus antarcticus]|uniref:Glutaredoxin domain-containing protein n=1 Tax=Cryoendolithus antarcticus TaxID=1507870 RepID=A0A1V8T0S9_9PEZI|nr:hypothetical protein B0A48_07952 [Cryoendolithus antarcticus]